jgi:gluconolactonase
MSETTMFEIFAEGLHLPEGPVVMDDGSVIVVEIAAGRITRCWGQGRSEIIATPGGGPNGLAIGPDGALYACNNGGADHEKMCHASGPGSEGRIERIDLTTGKVERLYDTCDSLALSAPNDLVIDGNGDIWFSDIGKVLEDVHHFGGVYRASTNGNAIRRVQRGLGGYNGVGLSPDSGTLYVAETFTGRLIALPTSEETPIPRLAGSVPGLNSFDSLAVTAAGNICVACPSDGAVAIFTPHGDFSRVDLPPHFTTNIAFGGDDMRTAYITQATSGALLRMRWAEAGLRLAFNG